MGKATGFLEYDRENNTDIPVEKRILDFKEFHVPLGLESRQRQGARCMDCGVPLCQSAIRLKGMVTGCPLHNLIPEWNDEVYRGHMEHALSRLVKTSNFPEFTGRVCPALCEKACINGEYGDAVTIHDNELFIIETAFAKGYIKPRIPKIRSGKRVAVVGSGPAGLAVADELNHRGHLVTVFERDDRVGGLLMYGIPNMKLDKAVIERRRVLMEEEGVVFKTGVDVGRELPAEEILREYDAVVLACGAKQPRALTGADPEKMKGVYYAVDFLKRTTKALLDSAEKNPDKAAEPLLKEKELISAKDKNVVVVGGGDTGNDCIGTVIRHGCRSVTALEMMPMPLEKRAAANPWPEWPKVLKTDYGHEEAIKLFGHDPRLYETTVKELVSDKKGHLKKIIISQVGFENGKLKLKEGTEKELPCDLLLIAAGFTGCEGYTADAFGLKLTPRGTVDAQEGSYRTSAEKVFSAGDMRRGQSLVVWAIAEGRACAAEVDRYLMGYTNMRVS